MKLADFHFDLPDTASARAPREVRGQRRDESKLLVIERASGVVHHRHFHQIGEFLRPGDIVVLNNSMTVPSALQARLDDGSPVEVRLAPSKCRDCLNREAVLRLKRGGKLLTPDEAGVFAPGVTLSFNGGSLLADIRARRDDIRELWRLQFHTVNGKTPEEIVDELLEPIRYQYLDDQYDLSYFQTVYASEPGSAEMPSAGRHFTPELLEALQAQGVAVAFITLHTGVSSIDIEEEDIEEHVMYEEQYRVSEEAAAAINSARTAGGRVVAVGTTVTRALETVTADGGTVHAAEGWTDIYITPGYRFKGIDGLITGLHEPTSTRIVLASAFVGRQQLLDAYHQALGHGYEWHEFGDAMLAI